VTHDVVAVAAGPGGGRVRGRALLTMPSVVRYWKICRM
jgi:hypothetical protein